MSFEGTKASAKEQAELDAALDAALAALDEDTNDDDESDLPASPNILPVMGPPRPPPSVVVQEDEPDDLQFINSMMQQLLRLPPPTGDDPPEDAAFGQFLNEMKAQFRSEWEAVTETVSTTTATTARKKEVVSKKPVKHQHHPSPAKTEVSQTVAALVEDMAKQAATTTTMDGTITTNQTPSSSGTEPEDLLVLLKNMMEDSSAATFNTTTTTTTTADGMIRMPGDNDDDGASDALLDGMMEQLLSKDLMYEPMKQVAQKFPDWLKERRKSLSEDEYTKYVGGGGARVLLLCVLWSFMSRRRPCRLPHVYFLLSTSNFDTIHTHRRCRQCECFQQLVSVYETEPDNMSRLMTLMQDVQEYGQPPMEIIQEIAPGLELDQDTGMPKLNNGSRNDECRIM
jgi:peroxin-19